MTNRIRRIYEMICISANSEEQLRKNNSFFSLVAGYLLIFGGIASFLTIHVFLGESLMYTLQRSIGLLLFGILFLLFRRIPSEMVKMFGYSLEMAAILMYCYINYYDSMGPAVWSIAFVQLLTILLYSNLSMLITYLSLIMVMILYAWYRNTAFTNWEGYYISNLILFALVSTLSIIVFQILNSRKEKILAQYNDIQIGKDKLHATLASVADGVIAVDENGLVEYLNPAAEVLTGWSEQKAAGQRFEVIYPIIHVKTRELQHSPIQTVFETQKNTRLSDHTLLLSADGIERPVEDTASPIFDKNGNVTGAVLVFRDISDQVAKRRKQEALSYNDHLTGLYNRRFFDEEILRIDQDRFYPLTFIFADVNGLKVINDAFGHDYGDQLIVEVAKGLKQGCRENDVIARIGGDEFVLLLPTTTRDAAETIITRIKGNLSKKTIMDIEVSFSFGLATKTSREYPTETIIKEAEDMMYQQKILDSYQRRNSVIDAIMHTLFQRYPYEEEHAKAVSELSAAIGKEAGVSNDVIEALTLAGQLHDIGKIALDMALLKTIDPLTDKDKEALQFHTEVGYRILNTSKDFHYVAETVLSHHEHWDGSGYPRGLKGEEIQWNARVLAIAEAYCHMVSQLPYKVAMTKSEALKSIEKEGGIKYDPSLIPLLMKVWEHK